MKCFVCLREGMCEVLLLDSLVCAERAFEIELLAPEFVAVLAFPTDALVNQSVYAVQRFNRTFIGGLCCGCCCPGIPGSALGSLLVPQPSRVTIMLSEQVAVAAVELFDVII
jgi:hypothetical protein